MTYRTLSLAALIAALMAGGPVLSQTKSTEEPAKAEEGAKSDEGAATEAPADAKPVMSEADLGPDTVVLTVSGHDITLAELIAVRQTLPEQYQKLPDEVLMGALLQQLSDQELMAAAATEKGLDKEPNVQLALKNQRRATLADAWMTEAMVTGITDEAVEKAYNETYAKAEPVQEVRASHILVEDEAKARDLKKQLDDGADFAALAAEHGTDATKTRGGDLGYFVKEQMVPEFADAAFAMEPDTVSDPVKSPFGWHLIYVTDKRERPVPPLEDVRDQIVQDLSRAMQEQVIKDVRADAEVEEPELAIPPAAIRMDKLLDQ